MTPETIFMDCPKCVGTGKCDDLEPGDIGGNEWTCPDCQGKKKYEYIRKDLVEKVYEKKRDLFDKLLTSYNKLDVASEALTKLRDCDWVITDRMDAVRKIADDALKKIKWE